MNNLTISDVISISSIIISTITSFLIYKLAKQLTSRDKLKHKSQIKDIADEHLYRIRKEGLNSEIFLVNINRYFKDYPSNSLRLLQGYSNIQAEIKSTTYKGIEFFDSMPREVFKRDGTLYFTGKPEEKEFNVFPVGLIPYSSIEYIDITGDEFDFKPLFYCKFNGKKLIKLTPPFKFIFYPYHEYMYYKKNEYASEDEPNWLRYDLIKDKIYP